VTLMAGAYAYENKIVLTLVYASDGTGWKRGGLTP